VSSGALVACRLTSIAACMLGVLGTRLSAQSELLGIEPTRQVPVGGGSVVALAFSSHGDTLSVLSQSGRVSALDLRSGVAGTAAQISGRPSALARSRDDARLVVTAGSDVTLIELPGNQRRTVKINEDATSAAISPAGNIAAVGTKKGNIVVLNAVTGDIIGRLRDGHSKQVVQVFFNRAGETLISVGEDRTITYWDVKRLERLRQITDPEPRIVSATAAPAGDLLFIGTEAIRPRTMGGIDVRSDVAYVNYMRAYDVQSAAPQKLLDLDGRSPFAIVVAPDCKYVGAVVRGIRGSQFVAFDLDRGASVVDLPLEGKATTAAFSVDGKSLAIGSESGNVMLYHVTGVEPRPRCVADLRGTKYAITGPQSPLVKPSRRMRFAVLDLDDNGVGGSVSRAIADQLTTRLSLNPGIRLVERRRIATILQEQNFEQTGRTDPRDAARLARILNVQKVLVGAVAKLGTTMTITVQMVDVETAAIDGVREVQCRACELEDLSQAVSELATTVVAEPDAAVLAYPAPPEISFDYPQENTEVTGNSVMVRGTVHYSRPLEGVELLVNGHPLDASRLFDRNGAKLTRFPDGTSEMPFVQEVPLEQAANLIAVRAVGADGNDEQRYVTVRKTGAPAPGAISGAAGRGGAAPNGAAAPALSASEIEAAVKAHVPDARITALAARFGVSFDANSEESRLRSIGATETVLRALRTARVNKTAP
jgi:WD40 repeat protein